MSRERVFSCRRFDGHPLVSVNFFTSYVLPQIDNGVSGNVKASQKCIKGSFPQKSESHQQTQDSGLQRFSAFPTVEHIVKAASPLMHSEPALEFVYKPNEARPVSERNIASHPDGLKAREGVDTQALGSSYVALPENFPKSALKSATFWSQNPQYWARVSRCHDLSHTVTHRKKPALWLYFFARNTRKMKGVCIR
jgi:hypothetical protein